MSLSRLQHCQHVNEQQEVCVLKRDMNIYTLGLAGIGFYAIVAHAFTWHVSDPIHFVIILTLIFLLDFLPIRMPSGMSYSLSVIGFIYTLYNFGLNTLVDVIVVSTVVSSIALTKRLKDISWYRLIVTIGMYYLSVLGAYGTIQLTTHLDIFIQTLFAVVAFEVLNLILLYGIQAFMQNKNMFSQFYRHITEIAVPMAMSTVVLVRLLDAKSSIQLTMEMFYAAFVLLVIIYLTNQYARMERQRRESDVKYRLIAENTSDFIVVINPKTHHIQYASPSHERVLGLESVKYIGTPFESWLHPSNHDDIMKLLHEVVELQAPQQLQALYAQRDCGWMDVEMKCSPVKNSVEQVDGIIVVLRDITERLHAESVLRKTDKLSVVGQLAAGVAHEIRNPLTALKGFLQLTKNKPGTNMKYYDIMWSEMNRIEFIISEFLILSKPQLVNFQICDVKGILESVIVLFEGQALLHNVVIEHDIPVTLPQICCEMNQLKQVFVNVIKNAIEAMSSGGHIYVHAQILDENYISVQVRDEGCGIPKERLSKLGEPFYTTKEKGTGLGLMVSYKIIEEHKGDMYVTSEMNQGTTVEIRLPYVTEK